MSEKFWKQFPPIPGFDCIKVKDEIQAKIYEEIKDMPPEEQIAYFNRAGNRFRRRMRNTASSSPASLVKEASSPYGKKKTRRSR
jgi:hypothetical protein